MSGFGVDLAVKLARTAAAVVGVAAVGAAAGLAAERATVRRPRRDDPTRDVLLSRPGAASYVVTAEDGVQLHVEVDEPPPRDPRSPAPELTVVFTSGYALTLDTWYYQRRDLADVGRLVLWDQRSHGRSTRSEGSDFEGVGQLGRDLGRVIDEVAPTGDLVIAGHSMGGMTVLSLARQRPELFAERVRGLALVCTSATGLGGNTYGLPGPVGRLTHRFAPGVLAGLARQPGIVERGRRAGSDLGFLVTKEFSFASPVPPSVVDLVAEMNASTPIDVLASFLPIFDVHDETAALPLIADIETLVIGAVQDRLVPVGHSRELAEALPSAEYLELDPAGHMAMLEHPDVVSGRLRALVDRARRDAAAAEVA